MIVDRGVSERLRYSAAHRPSWMSRWIPLAATIVAGLLVIGAVLAVASERLVLGGTLLMFTAFAIYVRETNTEGQ